MPNLHKWKFIVLTLVAIAVGTILMVTPLVRGQDSATPPPSQPTEAIAEVESTGSLQAEENGEELEIIQLQTRLKQKGYYLGAIDGVYGEETREAVYNFQLSSGLEATGEIDRETWRLLGGVPVSVPQVPQDEPSTQLLSPDIQKIVDRGELIVATIANDIAPFFVTNEGGKLEGLDVEIARGLADNLGVKLRFNRSAKTFNEVVDLVTKNEADLAISKLSQTFQRAKIISFSNPYLTMRHGLLLNRLQLKKAAQNKDIVDFLKDFEGRMGVINGSSYEGFAKQKFPKATIVRYSSWEDLIEGAIRGDILAAYRDELEVKKILINQPNAALNFQTVALTDSQDPIAIALPWSSYHLLEFVNLYLTMTDKSYTVGQLLADYSDFFEPANGTQTGEKLNHEKKQNIHL
jgi:ABC-type amino acid transport substrate-binding protein